MEAKETIIKCDTSLTCCLDCHKAQAEISFKAGKKEAYRKMAEPMESHGKAMFRAGIRKVLKWEEDHDVIGYVYDAADPEVEKQNMIAWANQLKEWGIK